MGSDTGNGRNGEDGNDEEDDDDGDESCDELVSLVEDESSKKLARERISKEIIETQIRKRSKRMLDMILAGRKRATAEGTDYTGETRNRVIKRLRGAARASIKRHLKEAALRAHGRKLREGSSTVTVDGKIRGNEAKALIQAQKQKRREDDEWKPPVMKVLPRNVPNNALEQRSRKQRQKEKRKLGHDVPPAIEAPAASDVEWCPNHHGRKRRKKNAYEAPAVGLAAPLPVGRTFLSPPSTLGCDLS